MRLAALLLASALAAPAASQEGRLMMIDVMGLDAVEAAATPPEQTSGRVEIGLRWARPLDGDPSWRADCGPVDLDLYVRAGDGDQWLSFDATRTPEGRHMGDQERGGAIELAQLDEVADMSRVQVAVNYVAGPCPDVRAAVRARHGDAIYELPFAFPAPPGDGEGAEPLWFLISGPMLFGLPPHPDDIPPDPVPDWAAAASVPLAHVPPASGAGPLSLGLRWTGHNCARGVEDDLRLHVREAPGAEWRVLRTVPIEPGASAGQAGAGAMELGEIADPGVLQMYVNLHHSGCVPSTGVVRARLGGAFYEHPFSLAGTQGSEGAMLDAALAGEAGSIWARIDPSILFDPARTVEIPAPVDPFAGASGSSSD